MAAESAGEVTKLLHLVQNGDKHAESQLVEILYRDLRRIASQFMRRERNLHTLQPTALVHEAYLRLLDQRDRGWRNRAHFLALAARTMRRILVDLARKRNAQKGPGAVVRVELTDDIGNTGHPLDEMLAVDAAIAKLAQLDARQAQIVDLRFFAGMRELEIAELLGVSERTVKREWRVARAWLYGELKPSATTQVETAARAKASHG